MTSLRQVLVEVLRERAARYTEDDIMKLVANDYTDKEALQTATRDGLLQAGLTPGKVDELLTRFSGTHEGGAPAGGARGDASGAGGVGRQALDEEADLREVEVTLDEDGVSTKTKTLLLNGKLYLGGLEKSLAGCKLVVLTVNGIEGIPTDEHGYTSRTFGANENITLGVARKPDDDARDEALKVAKGGRTWAMWAVFVSSQRVLCWWWGC